MDDPSPETKPKRKADPPRRAKGFERASALAPVALKGAGARRGFVELRLVTEWEAIVGAEFAALCRPVKVTWRGRGSGLGATLVVAASGARAPEVDMRAPKLLERVNAFYGYRAISHCRIDQSRAGARAVEPGLAEAAAPWEGPPPAPVEGIGDERLALALARLGANVRARARRNPKERTKQ